MPPRIPEWIEIPVPVPVPVLVPAQAELPEPGARWVYFQVWVLELATGQEPEAMMEPAPCRAMPIRSTVKIQAPPTRLPAQDQEQEQDQDQEQEQDQEQALAQDRELSIQAVVLAQPLPTRQAQNQQPEQQPGLQRDLEGRMYQAPARAPPGRQPSHHYENRHSGRWQALLKNSTEADSIAKRNLPRPIRLHPGSAASRQALLRCTSSNRHRTEPRDCPALSSSAAQARPLGPAEDPRVVPASRLPAPQRLRARAPVAAAARMRAAWALRLK